MWRSKESCLGPLRGDELPGAPAGIDQGRYGRTSGGRFDRGPSREMQQLDVPVRNVEMRHGRVDLGGRGRGPSREMHQLGEPVGESLGMPK